MTTLHTVTISGDEDSPRIEFSCHGTRESQCHNYPDCACESYSYGEAADGAGHPFVPHDECWMTAWFYNDSIDPCTDSLRECEIKPGMTGPIKTWFEGDYVTWEFVAGMVRNGT